LFARSKIRFSASVSMPRYSVVIVGPFKNRRDASFKEVKSGHGRRVL
jgi:hypothetical protein